MTAEQLEKKRAACRAWRARNKDMVAAYNKAYFSALPAEKLSQYNSEFRQRHLDEIRRKDRERYAKNPEPVKRRAKKWVDANKKRAIANARAWAELNREKRNAICAEWVKNNRSRSRMHKSKWQNRNKGKMRDLCRRWRRKNPGKVSDSCSRRRKSVIENSTKDQIEAACRFMISEKLRPFGICTCCDELLPMTDLHFDHVMPLARGGVHSPENLVLACASCNTSKSSKILFAEWNPPNAKI